MSMSLKQREALLAACFENTLEDEYGDELSEVTVNVPLLADTLLMNLLSRLDNISTEASLADALRYGLRSLSGYAEMVEYDGPSDVFVIDFPEPEPEPDSPDESDIADLRYDEARAAEKDES